jgi:hypothetical protein
VGRGATFHGAVALRLDASQPIATCKLIYIP